MCNSAFQPAQADFTVLVDLHKNLFKVVGAMAAGKTAVVLIFVDKKLLTILFFRPERIVGVYYPKSPRLLPLLIPRVLGDNPQDLLSTSLFLLSRQSCLQSNDKFTETKKPVPTLTARHLPRSCCLI